ncbi:hypothetical protein HRI_002753000 [Hibiscus trionum]|uniref:Uncharacterized protein n=1 Tax=Hibiscus trionum TaxID=183268 RepID=A0A9W7I7U8_HIBTR|nr:hypothetical protein HRI_002753000 [Hibiscus trionum]
MAFRLNPGGEGEADGAEKGQPCWFQEKKGSVFPVKKKLVKTMMVEYIANLFSSKTGGSGSGSSKKGKAIPNPNTSPSRSSQGNKSSTVNIFPHPSFFFNAAFIK